MLAFTSMPLRPMFRRRDPAGGEVADVRACTYQSWCAVGLNARSINTAFELEEKGLRGGEMLDLEGLGFLPLITAEPTMAIGTPNYLPNLREMMKAILRDLDHEGLIMIINADIFLHPEFSVSQLVGWQQGASGDFWVGRRLDVQALSCAEELARLPLGALSQQAVYEQGIDAIVVSSQLLEKALKCLPAGLTFGLPWWDLILPVALIVVGGRLRHMPSGSLLHVDHEGRSWGVSRWGSIGAGVVVDLRSSSNDCDDAGLAFRKILDDARARRFYPSVLKKSILYRIKSLVKSGSFGSFDISIGYLLALAEVLHGVLSK